MLKERKTGGLYAPDYYSEFQCIADKCRHSCCIDWDIYIDGETYEKYRGMDDILPSVRETEDGPCFALAENGRCPHLNEKGLCDIILSHGDGYLSEICRNHPRFYNCIGSGRIEAGLGIVCEEACRIILEDGRPFSLSKLGELEYSEYGEEMLFDALTQRDRIISVLEAPSTFDERLGVLRLVYGLSELYEGDGWLDRFLSLEMLDNEWGRTLETVRGALFNKNAELTEKYGEYYSRLLKYFVYRHVSTAESVSELRARLAFCILSVEVIRSLFENSSAQDPVSLADIARRYSAEIEYSEDNTEELIFAFESEMLM